MHVHSMTTLTGDSVYHSDIRLDADDPSPIDTEIAIDGK